MSALYKYLVIWTGHVLRLSNYGPFLTKTPFPLYLAVSFLPLIRSTSPTKPIPTTSVYHRQGKLDPRVTILRALLKMAIPSCQPYLWQEACLSFLRRPLPSTHSRCPHSGELPVSQSHRFSLFLPWWSLGSQAQSTRIVPGCVLWAQGTLPKTSLSSNKPIPTKSKHWLWSCWPEQDRTYSGAHSHPQPPPTQTPSSTSHSNHTAQLVIVPITTHF